MEKKNCTKVGVMQPYFFPYIGYWQLMNAVDKYVIYDDVNYINRGWIHRNRILVNGQPKYYNLPMLGASQNKLINQIVVNNDEKEINRNLSIIRDAYSRAPYYKTVQPILEKIITCKEENVAKYIGYSFEVLCEYLGINTELIMSSSLNKNCKLKGQEKIIDICKILEADEYYNAIGGQELYSHEEFEKVEMRLHFLKTDEIVYPQFQNEFQSNLSIIDVMMFNSSDEISDMLKRYTLV